MRSRVLRLKKFAFLAVLIIAVMSMGGCKRNRVSEGLLQTITEENTEKAKAWFSEHIPEAQIIEVAAERGFEEVSTDLVYGMYTLNEKTYNFDLNVVTGECLTDQHNEEYRAELAKLLSAEIGVPAEYITFYNFGEQVEGETVMDLGSGGEPLSEPVIGTMSSVRNEMLPYDITDLSVRAKNDYEGNMDYMLATVKLDSFDGLVDKYSDFELLKKHDSMQYEFLLKDGVDKDGVIIDSSSGQITEEDGTFKYFLTMDDDRYILQRWYNKDNRTEHETIASMKINMD